MSLAIHTPERTDQARQRQYFLPYQQRWLADESQFMIWEKSRRIGATYVVGYGDVRSVIKTPKWPVWFSSADESAAKEYIDYCETWAKVFDVVATNLGEVLLDGKDNVTALTLEFPASAGASMRCAAIRAGSARKAAGCVSMNSRSMTIRSALGRRPSRRDLGRRSQDSLHA